MQAALDSLAESWQSADSELQALHGHGGRQLLASSRVGSVGVGVFVILLFMGVCLAICLMGSRTSMPWAFYIMSTCVFAIIFAVLAASPKGPKPPKPDYGYDQTIIPLVVIAVLLCVGIVAAGMGMLMFHAAPKRYARPLTYRDDVLQLS